jgi:hypothetical protein
MPPSALIFSSAISVPLRCRSPVMAASPDISTGKPTSNVFGAGASSWAAPGTAAMAIQSSATAKLDATNLLVIAHIPPLFGLQIPFVRRKIIPRPFAVLSLCFIFETSPPLHIALNLYYTLSVLMVYRKVGLLRRMQLYTRLHPSSSLLFMRTATGFQRRRSAI